MQRAIATMCLLLSAVTHCAADGPPAGPPASAPASRPAATRPGSPDVDLAARRVAEQVDALVEVFRRDRYADREAAQRELLDLHESLFEPLANARTPAGERRAAAALLAAGLTEASIARELLPLSVEDRGRVAAFRKVNPEIVADIFSLSWRRQLDGYRKIGALGQAAADAGPLLRRGFQHPSSHVVTATFEAIRKAGIRDDAIVDELCGVLRNTTADQWSNSWYYQGGKTHLMALETLREMKSARAAPTLLALVRHPRIYNHQVQGLLIDALAGAGDPRALPSLMEAVEQATGRSSHSTSWSTNGKTHHWKTGDAALVAAIKLSGQNLKDYGVHVDTQKRYMHDGRARDLLVYGFPYERNRKGKENKDAADPHEAARKRLLAWWKEHRREAPWKGLTPLAPANLPGMNMEGDR